MTNSSTTTHLDPPEDDFCQTCGGTTSRGPSDGGECECAPEAGTVCPNCNGFSSAVEPNTNCYLCGGSGELRVAS